ncbi:hypothetical protein DON26_22500 [Salmonella enterica]|uniref:Uncharacterized protein n=1 Tax=Salmonella enterica TaxID=28901 RepID=A0A5T7YEW6_SALER|nr:hypothetical protein [Salmonella enterica subsp. diarizonae]EBN0775756.1 hypothetical protein [Salmonella enterica]EBN2890623.1 hypothetical protein [Salmonella enterica]
MTLKREGVICTPRAAEKSAAALLFNNLSDNLCGHSKIRILNVPGRKTNTKSLSEHVIHYEV